MHKLHLSRAKDLTFEEGCNAYIEYCKIRNLREGTIRHYHQSFLNFYMHIDKNMLVKDFTQYTYETYLLDLKRTLHNDISINAYLRDLITVVHYWMGKEWIQHFKMTAIKTDRSHIATYTEEELNKLLKKPDIRMCKFTEYQCWVITAFLFCTGVRQRSLINIKIKDLDFEQSLVNVNVTKNRKPLIVPLNTSLERILKEYLELRPHKSDEEYLFVNIFGQKLTKSTSYHMLAEYNKKRNVQTTGLHRFRHTFAKQWILNGGNVVSLSKILGHSGLDITQNYINLLVTDLNIEVNEVNLLKQFQKPELKRISLNKKPQINETS